MATSNSNPRYTVDKVFKDAKSSFYALGLESSTVKFIGAMLPCFPRPFIRLGIRIARTVYNGNRTLNVAA